AVGVHPVTAVYSGDANFSGSTSSAVTQTVNKALTSTTLVSSLNPSINGQSVTFTATVSVTLPGHGPANGTITFRDGSSTLGTATLNGSGQATFTTSTLALGLHFISAVYSGSSNFNGSTSAVLTQTVTALPTTTVLTSSVNPSNVGQTVIFTATVSGSSGTPTGTVTFKDGFFTTLGTGTLNAAGQTTFTTSTLAAGNHTITAIYSGDATYAGSSAVLTQTVTKASTSTTLVSSLNPSSYGQSITFTATVTITGSGGGTLSGTVSFVDGANTLSNVALNSSGQATYTTTTLSGGTHSLTAVYGGNSALLGSTSPVLSQVVNLSNSTTTLT